MTEQLTFEVGKSYRTRGGEKLLCVHIFPNKALFVNESLKTFGTRWLDGRLSNEPDNPHDIVGEWREPRQWTVYVVEYSDGETVSSLNPGDRKIVGSATVTEGEGLG